MNKSRQYAIVHGMADQSHKEPISPAQIDKFRDLARELECDEDEEAFKAKVKTIVTARKPEPSEKQK